MRLPAACALAALTTLVAAPAAGTGRASSPTLAQLVGQKLVVTMSGTAPSASLLGRVRRGEVGGVIVHGFNFSTAAGLRAITRSLQRAAAAGGRPRLLIAVDQEGGRVKTVPWIAPTLAPSRMRNPTLARDQGRRAATALRRLGVNVDLAPVVDVPASRASAVYRQGRTWSFDARETATLAAAFAAGLRAGGAAAAPKHFPGLGFALRNTDRALVRITASRAQLAPGLEPFRRAIAGGAPLVMLSNAIYTAYDRRNGAGWSRAIATGLLRDELGFKGVTITDALEGPAHIRGASPNGLAIAAAAAGADLILLTGSEGTSGRTYLALLRAARSGRLRRPALEASYARIVALKGRL